MGRARRSVQYFIELTGITSPCHKGRMRLFKSKIAWTLVMIFSISTTSQQEGPIPKPEAVYHFPTKPSGQKASQDLSCPVSIEPACSQLRAFFAMPFYSFPSSSR
jgi:hypothetical protein